MMVKKEEIPEELPPTAQQQLRELTATCQRMLDGLGESAPTSDSLKTINLLKQLILGNAQLELSVAKQNALRTEKEIKSSISSDEQRLALYEVLIERLGTPEGIEDMRASFTEAVEAMREKGIRSPERTVPDYFVDVDEGD